ncbi:MAG: hypothetical protein MHM6MM_005442 [Cercozoa sp. M6MM]
MQALMAELMLRFAAMSLLSKWLLFVASLRFLSVVLGYLGPKSFRERVFTRRPEQVSPVAARLFSVWTLLTCALCVMSALEPSNVAMHSITFFSFLVALGFFALEFLVYRTLHFRGLVGPLIIASVSSAWMWVEWP